MHHYIKADDIRPTPAFREEAAGYRRFALSDRDCGAVHSGWGLCELDANGHVNEHLQSFEKSFYVLEGEPVLILGDRARRLGPGACGLIPVGMRQAWLGPASGTAKWLDMNTPVPTGANFADDTYFVGPPPDVPIEPLDLRDPTSRHLFRMADDDIRVDALRAGPRTDAPRVSASVATAVHVFGSATMKMLVDERLDAALHTMFMVEYGPNGCVHPHNHPLEEAYFVLEGEVETRADEEKYLLRRGDFLWAGVGCTHAFYNRSNANVRWLETQSPQPPARHAYRFARDWEYFAEQLRNKRAADALSGKKTA